MLNNEQEIIDFKEYKNLGGLQKPLNYTIAKNIISLSEEIKNNITASINNDLNYNSDGIQELPIVLKSISAKLEQAIQSSKSLIDYLDLAATPTDIEQVAIGVNIIRKLNNVDDLEPAPSMLPITEKTVINGLKDSLSNNSNVIKTATDLMIQINTAITPLPPVPPATTSPQNPLPSDLKSKALSMVNTIKPVERDISEKVNLIIDLVSSAKNERDKAIIEFKSCIEFTLLNSQKNKPSVSGAATAIYPK